MLAIVFFKIRKSSATCYNSSCSLDSMSNTCLKAVMLLVTFSARFFFIFFQLAQRKRSTLRDVRCIQSGISFVYFDEITIVLLNGVYAVKRC